jgi:DNA-binding response OmpR family regulator
LRNLETEESPPSSEIPASVSEERFLSRGKLTLDLHTRRVTIGKRVVNLPPTAFDYLLVLARHAPNVVDYQTLVAEAQGYEAGTREAQELAKWHIHHIRQAIEADAQNPTFIINVRGSGYRFVAN